jgi:hypothetical protein
MNRKMFFLTVCILSQTLLVGCAERWQKPGATDADFQDMKSTCGAQALARFPVVLRQMQAEEGHANPVVTKCSGSGASIRCTTSGGQYVPPRYLPVDDNKETRDRATRKCLIENGWRPVE